MIVCTAGGIEEDFIKCMGDTHVGDFALKGEELRKKGINRIGNLLIPNQVLRKSIGRTIRSSALNSLQSELLQV